MAYPVRLVLVAAMVFALSALAGAQTRPSAAVGVAGFEAVRSVGYLGRYIGIEGHASIRYGVFGAGAGLRFMAGTSQLDVHLAPLVRAELWWFYANGGWVIEVADRTDSYQVVDNGPFVAFGIVPTVQLGRIGRFGIDIGYELFFPLRPDPEQPPAPRMRDLVADWYIGTLVEDIYEIFVPNGMLRVGLLYTFPIETRRMTE